MSNHQPFHYHSLAELRQDIQAQSLDLNLSEDVGILFQPFPVGSFTLSNRFVVLPMEGCDGHADGSPAELTFRRYQRFAAGGAGLLWFEATAVVSEGRANPRQLWIHNENINAFASLIKKIHQEARNQAGVAHRPLLILQLTHSGRYSRPVRKPHPIIAHHSPFLDPLHQLPPDYPLISDAELAALEDRYVEAARCAQQAGFDGVDVKACHRYLVSELLASHTRVNSGYGGVFENRTRFLLNVVGKIRAAVPGLFVTTRLNVFDAMAHPYGFGVDQANPVKPDLTEPIKLVHALKRAGVSLVNVTIGNPYYNPHVNRPFDMPTVGAPLPTESPLAGVARFAGIVRQLQTTLPEVAMIGGGYSWLRHFLPYIAAANVQQGWVSLIGAGRLAFAYPNFIRELKEHGRLDPQKVCVACSACTQIMRDGGRTGCVPRDSAIYESIYKHGRANAMDVIVQMAKTCRQCNDPTCVGRCPAQVNIPQFVAQIAAGQMREAYETLRQANVLAAMCGYVCPAEIQCESGCINQAYTNSVPIRHLQRWVSQRALDEGWIMQSKELVKTTGRRIAVIGAGPAGLAAAATLAAYGHQVALLDRQSEPGGMARDTIPWDRLPDPVMRAEIKHVLSSYGDRIEQRKVSLSSTYNLDRILAEGFDAVVLACGLGQSISLPNARSPATGVIGALEFLSRAKQGQTCNGTILVLGGGNTALDAAMVAKQSGAADVSIVYRRSFAEMPAWPQERDKAIQAGIHFLTLTAPLEYVLQDHGRLSGLKVIRTKLGALDAHGRRSPQPIPGTEHNLPADLIIEAFGQQIEEELKLALTGIGFTEHGLIWTRPGSTATSRMGVFAAGDIINGGATVVQAVAEGARSAREIHGFLQMRSLPKENRS